MSRVMTHLAVVGAGVGAAGALAFSGTAGAATTDHQADHGAAANTRAASSAVHPDASWKYIDSYFWGSDCINAGNNGVDHGAWSTYECTGGGTWSDYQLWVWN